MDDKLKRIFPGILSKQDIERIELAMLMKDQVDCPVIHRFGPGIYIRELFVPADTIAVGHYQKTEHLNIMLTGKVTVLEADGSTREITAPTIFVGKPGRKIGYVQEPMVWLNVYSTTETDVEKLEGMFLDKSEGWKQTNELQQGLAKLGRTRDRDDYKRVLEEFGFTEELARAQATCESDQVPFPFGGYKVMVTESPIDGKGLFATAELLEGELIAPARIAGKRTPAGRFTNHSADPNARMVKQLDDDIVLFATKRIRGAQGGYTGEEITIDYREALRLSVQPIKEEGEQCQE